MHARRWTAGCLRALVGEADGAAELIDNAVLCASELVTNAVRAGCTRMSIRLMVGERTVRLSVLDDAPGEPAPRPVDPLALAGRGLRLVEAVTDGWGVDAVDRGKEVWARFPRPG
jgi:anti-sigma regulatory factor (Ser/Thr protein kinase)